MDRVPTHDVLLHAELALYSSLCHADALQGVMSSCSGQCRLVILYLLTAGEQCSWWTQRSHSVSTLIQHAVGSSQGHASVNRSRHMVTSGGHFSKNGFFRACRNARLAVLLPEMRPK